MDGGKTWILCYPEGDEESRRLVEEDARELRASGRKAVVKAVLVDSGQDCHAVDCVDDGILHEFL